MTSVFRVLDVFRPTQRRGPILVGEAPSASISVGTRLVSADDPAHQMEVLAVDLPTATSLAKRRLAVVVSPDLGDVLAPGAAFEIVDIAEIDAQR